MKQEKHNENQQQEKNWDELYEKIADIIDKKYGLDKKEAFTRIKELEKSISMEKKKIQP